MEVYVIEKVSDFGFDLCGVFTSMEKVNKYIDDNQEIVKNDVGFLVTTAELDEDYVALTPHRKFIKPNAF